MKKEEQEKTFLKAYEELSDALFRHSYFRVSNREVALDIVQEGFTKTWQYMLSGNEIRSIRPFLYRVINNLIIDYYRKARSDSLDVLLDEGFDPSFSGDKEIEGSAEMSVVRRALSALPERDRDLIIMRYVDGLSIGEIASLLGENENVVSVRLHRALNKAKEIFNKS